MQHNSICPNFASFFYYQKFCLNVAKSFLNKTDVNLNFNAVSFKDFPSQICFCQFY